MTNIPAVSLPSPPRCPPRFLQRDGTTRIALAPIILAGEPAVSLSIWRRSPNETDDVGGYVPTSAVIVLPAADLDEFVGQLRDAAREARGSL